MGDKNISKNIWYVCIVCVLSKRGGYFSQGEIQICTPRANILSTLFYLSFCMDRGNQTLDRVGGKNKREF